MGFVAGSAVIVLYVVLITKSIYIAKTAKDDTRSVYCYRNCGNIYISYVRKYWYGNGAFANYWGTTSIRKLWW